MPLNDRNLIIMIANTNVKHALGDSQYPVRVKQCKAAVQAVSGLPIYDHVELTPWHLTSFNQNIKNFPSEARLKGRVLCASVV